jgi:hypothetical protein
MHKFSVSKDMKNLIDNDKRRKEVAVEKLGEFTGENCRTRCDKK